MSEVHVLNRRGFLGNVFSAGAFVLTARLWPEQALGVSNANGTGEAASAAWAPSVYLGIEPDGTAIIVTHRSRWAREFGASCRRSSPKNSKPIGVE
jgi:isoquinoline 1-oxidoreductase beta subunit